MRKGQLHQELSGWGNSTYKGPVWVKNDTCLRNKRPLWLQKVNTWERRKSEVRETRKGKDCRALKVIKKSEAIFSLTTRSHPPPSELSAETLPEQILNEAEAHSTFHLFIHQRGAQDTEQSHWEDFHPHTNRPH